MSHPGDQCSYQVQSAESGKIGSPGLLSMQQEMRTDPEALTISGKRHLPVMIPKYKTHSGILNISSKVDFSTIFI